MGTISSAIFSGNSRYSQDFRSVIDRAVAIASLPMSQLNTEKVALTSQSDALAALDEKFQALQTAVQGIQNAFGGSSFEAAVSDESKVSATVGDGATEGTYSIEVLDAGAYASSMTKSAWNSSKGAHVYALSLGGKTYSLSPAGNGAANVATAINSAYGDKVRASVVNVGTTDMPDYRLSLQATHLGDLAPDLLVDGASLQNQQVIGAQAHYVVNGSGKEVYSSARTVTLTTGLTVNLKAACGPVDITVTRSTSALGDALSAFATAYNAAADELDKQHGETTGPLSGQTVVNQLSEVLSDIATYDGTAGSVNGLASVGLNLDKTGRFTFNSFQLIAADLTAPSDLTAFFGSSTASGFLKSATGALNSVEAAGAGILAAAKASVQSQITETESSIADQQERVNRLQTQLQEQMAAMDALIASMEQQYNYVSGMFSAMDTASRGY